MNERPVSTLRDLFRFKPADGPIPLGEVAPMVAGRRRPAVLRRREELQNQAGGFQSLRRDPGLSGQRGLARRCAKRRAGIIAAAESGTAPLTCYNAHSAVRPALDGGQQAGGVREWEG